MPLIVGALNTTAVPLFTLKFSLVLVNKLIPTISKLNLLNQLGSLLFEDKEILYTGEAAMTRVISKVWTAVNCVIIACESWTAITPPIPNPSFFT